MRVFLILLALLAIGCGKEEIPVASSEQNVQEIIKKSNGNWEALSDADRQTLIQELGRGDEVTARVSFKARTTTGGPPIPGSF